MMKTAQKNFMTIGFKLEKQPRWSLGGLASVAATVVFLVAVWSDTSKSTAPSVVLAFPPKPSQVQSQLSNDPIIFDWPAIELLPNELENVGVIDSSRTESSIADGESILSPEAALAGLIEDIAPVGVSDIAVSLAKLQTSDPGTGNPSPSPDFRPDRAARLATLTLLADLETIANAGEFAKALRAVGLETLIQPGQPYTMLVPSDAAFAKLGRDELRNLLHPNGHGRLRALLSNHILKDRLQFDDFAGEVRSYFSLADQSITIVATDVIKVEDASMIETDLTAANTVVHVIDSILVPGDPQNNVRSPSATAL